jgi:YVTN family beta-propeller protein
MAEGPYLYVPNEYDNTVSIIDTANNSVVATIPVPGTYADSVADWCLTAAPSEGCDNDDL